MNIATTLKAPHAAAVTAQVGASVMPRGNPRDFKGLYRDEAAAIRQILPASASSAGCVGSG